MTTVSSSTPWTVLLYIGAQDKPSSADVLGAIRTPHSCRVEFVYQLATSDATTRAHLRQDGTWETQWSGPPIDISDATHVTRFVDWAQASFPSRRTALFVRDDGYGFDTTRPTLRSGALAGVGLFMNNTANTYMPTPDLRHALERTRSGRVDVLGFDACQLGTVEVGYELRNVAGFVVGSESIEPWTGWPYKELIDYLGGEVERVGPRQLTEFLVKTANVRPTPGGPGGFDLIGLQTSWLELLANKLDKLADALLDRINPASAYAAKNKEVVQLIDQLDQLAAAVPNVDEEVAAVTEAFKAAKVGDAGTRLAVFFPGLSGATMLASYGSMEFARTTKWAKLVSTINRVFLEGATATSIARPSVEAASG